jgi:hypothetical protein
MAGVLLYIDIVINFSLVNVFYDNRTPSIINVLYYSETSEDPVLKLGAPIPSPNTEVTMLGYPDKFDYIVGPGGQGVCVTIPKISWNKLPCQWVWVLKMTSIEN